MGPCVADLGTSTPIAADPVTASASDVDPNYSVAAGLHQATRVALARGPAVD